eukprot:Gb_27073 [translate_table: standard]
MDRGSLAGSIAKISSASKYAEAACSLKCLINPRASSVPSSGFIKIPISSRIVSVPVFCTEKDGSKLQGDFHPRGDPSPLSRPNVLFVTLKLSRSGMLLSQSISSV